MTTLALLATPSTLDAIAELRGKNGLRILAGYVLTGSALVAWYVATILVLRFGRTGKVGAHDRHYRRRRASRCALRKTEAVLAPGYSSCAVRRAPLGEGDRVLPAAASPLGNRSIVLPIQAENRRYVKCTK
jgi:hypothetical protein